MSVRSLHAGLCLATGSILIGLSGCGSSGGEAATDSTSPATTIAVATTIDGEADFLVASNASKECYMAAVSSADTTEEFRAALDCLTDDEVIATERNYLEKETEATADQVDCVETTLRELGSVGMRDAIIEGIGQAAYVPCGLPD